MDGICPIERSSKEEWFVKINGIETQLSFIDHLTIMKSSPEVPMYHVSLMQRQILFGSKHLPCQLLCTCKDPSCNERKSIPETDA